ncbi:LapA family protein [Kutzneria kofuensis]|uniref:Putative integral membrane protein n=1 Tax=Kutzneria kofuensis TaxID=103725 RepID=A0A7W9KN73_9PSEU|nr:lipopolysaccharide assembly protein LapA domain-containing protein [Kutzneria kofuensis]MBB5895665.1 putative integral membrane protein [Kutzneria kofuensis]
MTEPNRGAAAQHETPEVPPMRDAVPETPAVPAMPGGMVPGGGAAIEPAATDTEVGRPGAVEPGVADTPAAEPVRLKRTRISGLWVGITVAAVVLLLLLVFIVQNNTYVTIYFFGWGGQFPLGVALLLAAICGVLLVAIPGYGRIIQLRRSFRKASKQA